jgi:vesicle coat complex subunit
MVFYHGADDNCSKEAIQKTIMAMTLGKDVSQLFPDVLKNIATADLDQKKLVYLYLMFVPQVRAGAAHC